MRPCRDSEKRRERGAIMDVIESISHPWRIGNRSCNPWSISNADQKNGQYRCFSAAHFFCR
jgi:hypothetical protein